MDPFCRVTPAPLDAAALRAALADPRAGALVIFEGVARNHHDGRPVASLAYEAFVPMAEAVLGEICREAQIRFGLTGCGALHRIGELAVGEAAVLVGCAAVHRQEAFEAAAYIMDRIKSAVPVWKRECYAGGSAAWVEGESRVPEA